MHPDNARSNPVLAPIQSIADKLGILPEELELYGRCKAKVHAPSVQARRGQATGKLVLVTALTPTRAGDGKTCISIGLTQGLQSLGARAVVCLRQPSLGPIFGMKGGAAGAGLAQVQPMESINMHFTGDFHAIAEAHNVLAALVDNHVHFGNELGIDPAQIVWRRVLDVCDRQLRHCELGLGGSAHGFPHKSGFDITAASEIMAICALAQGAKDLSERLGRVVIGYRSDGAPISLEALGVKGALEVLLKDTLSPNLVQTTEQAPALIHCGPFANIAHGSSSLIATKLGLATSEYVVTEAGFAADLGAEKFLHIKCRALGLMPAVAVLVVTCRALKHHGGVEEDAYASENVAALETGFENVRVHIENLRKFGLPVVVAINRFPFDTDLELARVRVLCDGQKAPHAVADVVLRGGEGGVELGERVIEAARAGNRPFLPLYDLKAPLRHKVETLAREIYRADGIDYAASAEHALEQLEHHGFGELGVCVAKTQSSLSDDAKLRNVPKGHRLHVRDVELRAGAGYVVPKTGHIELMPGLPKRGAAFRMGLGPHGEILGLK